LAAAQLSNRAIVQDARPPQRRRTAEAGGDRRSHVPVALAMERRPLAERIAPAKRQARPASHASLSQRRPAGGHLPRDGRLPGAPPPRPRNPQSSPRAADDAPLPYRSDGRRPLDRRAEAPSRRKGRTDRPRHARALALFASTSQRQPVRLPRRRGVGRSSYP